MGRGKLSMKLISNEKSRKTTFLKREKSLMRKAYELSTLCDVRTCVFVYGPSHNDQSPTRVHTWPPCRDEVNDMIASYKANCLHKRTRKAFGLLDFFSERKKKIEGDMSKLRKDVAEARFPRWDERLDYLLEDELRILLVELDTKLDATKRRIDIITENFEEGTSAGSSIQALNANMKQKQLMAFDQDQNYMFGSSGIEAQAMIPYPYHHQYHQIQTMAQNLPMESTIVPKLPMDHEINLSQYSNPQYNPYCSIGSSAQAEFNCRNYFPNPNFFSNPQYDPMLMDNQHIYAMCQYADPLSTQYANKPLSFMQFSTDNELMMASDPSKSQIELMATAPNQGNDQAGNYLNCEYFMKSNNFSNY